VLFIVGTPIGNFKDITLRALDTIKECDVVFSEDTRETLKLLNHYSISKPVFRYNDHIEESGSKIFESLLAQKKVCLISDGGMPNISDPGAVIIKKARQNNISVEVIGGVSAVINAISGSGFDGSGFIFLGFMPRTESKITGELRQAFVPCLPVVVYESPYRIIDFLEIVSKNFTGVSVVIAREMTKLYEEWISGDIKDVIDNLKKKDLIKGEITVILSKKSRTDISDVKSAGFVCSANTCRSAMSEYYARKKAAESGVDISFSSAGILAQDEYVCDHAAKILKNEGIENITHRPCQIDFKFVENNDLILVMTRKHKEIIKNLFPQYEKKIFTLLEYAGFGNGDIYDPYGKSYMEYEIVFRQIKKAIDSIIENYKFQKAK
jgi:16S rRNA (cytidine1402-2'-O)-methyltransferase